MFRYHSFIILSLIIIISCSERRESLGQNNDRSGQDLNERAYPVTGSIEIIDPALHDVIRSDAKIEILAEGMDWSEGPLWLPKQQLLLFSDIPPNTIYQWSESSGLEVYLKPSGYTGDKSRGGEVGSNGLLLDTEGRLVLCQHGDRRMVRMTASLTDPKPEFITLANSYDGKRLNSPNDAVYKSNGDLYFTDPPYGLEEKMKDPSKELPFQGVKTG